MERTRVFSEAVWDALRDPLVLLDAEFRIRRATASFYRTFKTSLAQVDGKSLFEIDGGAWNLPRLRERLEKVLKSGEYHLGIDAPLLIPRLGPGSLGLRIDARKVHLEESGVPMILLVISERQGKA